MSLCVLFYCCPVTANHMRCFLPQDNGGDCRFGQPAINFPLKGRKCSVWDGGTRVAAMVSGGFIPAALRGTTVGVLMHVADCE